MAKESGLAWTACTVDDGSGSAQAIVNDITNLSIGHPRGVLDTTGIDKSAYERILGLADFVITLNGVFNDAANMSHVVFKTVPSSAQVRTVTITVSGQSYSTAPECIFSDYALTRATDGSLTWSAPGQLSDGAVPTWA